MKLILIVDDEIKYEDEQNNYDAEVYMDTDDFLLIFKSLKNIKPNLV